MADKKTYTVSSPLVIVRNPEQGGRQEYLYQGSPLPGYVTDAERDLLLADGHLTSDSAGLTPVTTPDEGTLAEPVKPTSETSRK